MKRQRVHFVNIRWVVFGVVYLCFVVLPAQIQNSESKSALVYAGTKTYVFVPDQSSVLERNWSWGYYEEWYYIEGEFQFTVDFNDVVGTAGFDWVDGELGEEITYCENGIQVTQSLDVLFHLTDLNCIDGNDTRISFLYEKNNPTFPGADVNVIVTLMGHSIQLSGRFSDECYDGGQYDLDAIGVLKKYGGGLGDTNNPYLIFTSCEMNDIGANPNDWDKHFRLMADIDLGNYTGTQFSIIGGSGNPFTGVFDGDGHTISKFTYDSNGVNYIGLFGYINGPNTEIRNLRVTEPNINAGTGSVVGSLVGEMEQGTITNCYVKGGTVSGYSSVGGLAGSNREGVIQDCQVSGIIEGQEACGGITGACISSWPNYTEIRNSSFRGQVRGTWKIGGIAGYINESEIVKCHAIAEIIGEGQCGGIIGFNRGGNLKLCFSKGTIICSQHSAGGFTGITSDHCGIGGDIQDCYSDVTVNCSREAGGFSGSAPGQDGQIRNCYCSGKVVYDMNNYEDVGGFIGENREPNGVFSSYFLESSGPDSGFGEPLSIEQMKQQGSFAGWDFVGEVINGPNDFWDICEGTNYPKFVWQIPVGDFICPDGVTFVDFSVLGAAWMCEPNDYCWDPNYDISEPNDNIINERDLEIFVDNWMEGI